MVGKAETLLLLVVTVVLEAEEAGLEAPLQYLEEPEILQHLLPHQIVTQRKVIMAAPGLEVHLRFVVAAEEEVVQVRQVVMLAFLLVGMVALERHLPFLAPR